MSWAASEFEDAWFGDDRLRRRAIRVCERLAEHPSESSVLRTCRSGGGIPGFWAQTLAISGTFIIQAQLALGRYGYPW